MQEVAINRNTPLYQLSSNDYNDQPHVQEEDTDHLNSRLTLTGLSLLKDYMASTTRNFSSEILQKFSILNLDNEELRNIIFSSRPPCRWQEIEHHRHVFYENQTILVRITIILDIAHNQPAIEALMKKVKSKLKDKNVR